MRATFDFCFVLFCFREFDLFLLMTKAVNRMHVMHFRVDFFYKNGFLESFNAGILLIMPHNDSQVENGL